MAVRDLIQRLVASTLVLVTACSETWHARNPAQLRAHAYDRSTLFVVTEDHAFELADGRVIEGTLHGTAVESWALTPGVSAAPCDGDSRGALEREHGWRDTQLGRPRFATSAWPALAIDLSHVRQVGYLAPAGSTRTKFVLGAVAAVAIVVVSWLLVSAFLDGLGSLDARD